MNNAKGFTLIELVAVIVILGILSAIALPKFISLQGEARIANLEASRSALRSGVNLIYAKQATAGNLGTNGCIESDATPTNTACPGSNARKEIKTIYGYPQEDQDSITAIFDDLSLRFSFSGNNPLLIRLDAIVDCELRYTGPINSNTPPEIVIIKTGC